MADVAGAFGRAWPVASPRAFPSKAPAAPPSPPRTFPQILFRFRARFHNIIRQITAYLPKVNEVSTSPHLNQTFFPYSRADEGHRGKRGTPESRKTANVIQHRQPRSVEICRTNPTKNDPNTQYDSVIQSVHSKKAAPPPRGEGS